MLFAIDIDGTIAQKLSTVGFKPVVDYYKQVAIGIPESISDYDRLLENPHFQAYCHEDETRFQAELKDILESASMMLTYSV